MKLFLSVLACLTMFVIGGTAATALATNDHPDKVTICHAAGLAGTTHYETLTIGYEAVYGPGGHFNENGTPQAGHEQDYLGPCQVDEEDQTLAAGVTFHEATCTTGASFTFVKTSIPGVGLRPFYNVEGPIVDGKPVAGESYTITAIPVEGYVFEGQTVWTHTFAAAPTNCGTPPPPCPNGEQPIHGQDGNAGNDACNPCLPPVNAEKCPPETTTTTTTTEPPPTTTEPPPATTTPEPPSTTPVVPPPAAKPPAVKPPAVAPPALEKQLKKQEKKNGAPNAPAPHAQAPGELPNTGAPLGLVALLGSLLTIGGWILRRT